MSKSRTYHAIAQNINTGELFSWEASIAHDDNETSLVDVIFDCAMWASCEEADDGADGPGEWCLVAVFECDNDPSEYEDPADWDWDTCVAMGGGLSVYPAVIRQRAFEAVMRRCMAALRSGYSGVVNAN
jgi:hypothetical protein